MTNDTRLIERAFPLKQASLDSVHEKSVRHGHISTLHIWPARRPLAASRAALIATLLPDPGTAEERQKLCEKIGGKVVQKTVRKKLPGGRTVQRIKEETEEGILHWKRETENSHTLKWFRQEIRKAYGGRAPRILDPFAGGGAIPLEAMRLGCEVTAIDINPVAWFILKCTLEFPQKLSGKTHPLPHFILEDEEFTEAFYKDHPHLIGKAAHTKKQADEFRDDLFMGSIIDSQRPPEADLAWHVRAWGEWVLKRARRDLAKFYPTYADFEPLAPIKVSEAPPVRLVPLREDGTPDVMPLNADFTKEYLANKRNPRWVAKPTVAYLWARTVTCKNCRSTLPLLKTRWLCKKANKRVLLTMEPNHNQLGLMFGIENDVPVKGSNPAQRREHDKRNGVGTMSRAGARCPCCGTINTMEDIRVEGKAGRLGTLPTVVVVDGQNGKEYRLPTQWERQSASEAGELIDNVFAKIPLGLIDEPINTGSIRKGGVSITRWGINRWRDVFSERQLLALGTFLTYTRSARDAMAETGYPLHWIEATACYLSAMLDRLANQSSAVSRWNNRGEKIEGTFARFALSLVWDYAELNPLGDTTGGYASALEWVSLVARHLLNATDGAPRPSVRCESATTVMVQDVDIVLTDPPYYDAIPYSDVMDFFYVWLRRATLGLSPEFETAFREVIAPKWDREKEDGELIEDESRFEGSRERAKQAYEDGMSRAFSACHQALQPEGRFITVFANKQPDAWETLVAAIIRAGFIVDGSWPIQTEMTTRTRALTSAALASSVWLVCKKRPANAGPGWDNKVLDEMRERIVTRLREFWDAGIRGPDFVWAATGPALEAYSKHPVVKKANDPGKILEVGEFLSNVRRMVVDFVVGQVLTGKDAGDDLASADRMDAPTAYYLLHRHDFGLEEAPSGACILYATACGLSDTDLESTWDILARSGTSTESRDEDEDIEESEVDADANLDEDSDSGSKVKLKAWAQRKQKSMGYEAPGGQPVPLIDRIHRLMHLWRAGEVVKVDEYLDEHALRRQELFRRLLQSLIELSRKDAESQELQILESLSNHVQAKGATLDDRQVPLAFGEEN